MRIFQVQIVIIDEKEEQDEEAIGELFDATIAHGEDFRELDLVGHVAKVVRDTESERV